VAVTSTTSALVLATIPWWGWVVVGVIGLFLMGVVRSIRVRQARTDPRANEREGPWSFFYYVFVDWWIDWF
jgi:beta-lactamase regulating signal transducer with metallopeptidase domain